MDLDEFLQGYVPQVQELALETRTLLLKAFPGIHEEVDAPSKLVAYGYGPRMKDMLCVIMPLKAGVNLGFFRGVDLPDPAGLLQGTGKRHRHVRIHDSKELHSPAVRDLVAAALDTYQIRSVKGDPK
jgi:hypothetical protein